MEMETLKSEMTHMAKPLSQGFPDNGHKAQPMFNLALVFLGALPEVSVYTSARCNAVEHAERLVQDLCC